ncbi:MAG: M56 family metallopeptidase [Opitutaceae bacterium]
MRTLGEILLAFWPRTAEGWASHIWQSTIAGCGILCLLNACPRLTAGARRAIAWVGLAKFVVPASGLLALASALPFLPRHWAILRAPVFSVPLPEVAGPPAGGPAAPPGAASIGAFVAAIWLAVALLFFLSWAIRGIRLRRRTLRTARPPSPHVQECVAAAAARAGLRRVPRCVITAESQGPGILGVLAPVVIIPEGLEGALAAGELESILIHEFVHIRRRDPLLNALHALILSLYWFDPIAWFLSRRIGIETEKSCDERVLAITGNAGVYVDGIMKALHHSLGLPQPAFAEAAAMPVVSRINSILSQGPHLSRPLVRNSAVGAACLVAALSGYAGFLAVAPPGAGLPQDRNAPGGPAANSASGREFARSAALIVNLVQGAPDDDFFYASEVDKAPAVLVRIPPRYPASLPPSTAREEVVLDLTVDSAGNPKDVRVVRSSAQRLEQAAIESVFTWSFAPAEKSGRQVNARIRVTVAFGPPQAQRSDLTRPAGL